MNRYIIEMIVLLLCISCSTKDDPEPTPKPPIIDRTVLVYMSGENDLTQNSYNNNFLEEDLKEMDEGSYQLNKNQHLIVFIDSIGKKNYPHIIEIVNGKRNLLYQYDSEFPACDPAKFSEVIKWTMDNYPSKEYGLVLWGHATGWVIDNDTIASSRLYRRAYGYDYGWDQIGGSRKCMNVTQMAKALENFPKFKYLFVDCCCFMCVESAYELRHTADYLIGSPAEIPGEGAPYHLILPLLFSQSPTFYRDICDTYYNYYLEDYMDTSLKGYSVPMSTIDLSQMDNLAKETCQIIKTFVPQYPDELDLSNMPFYFGYDISPTNPMMYDMKTVISKYASSSDYSQWQSVYNQAVPYQLVSMKWNTVSTLIDNRFNLFPQDETQYGCVSMFFPQKNYDRSSFQYNSRIKHLQWYYNVEWNSFGW